MTGTPSKSQSRDTASPSKSSISDEERYLPTFRQIAPRVLYHDPSLISSEGVDIDSNDSNHNSKNDDKDNGRKDDSNSDPDLIIFCSWMHAQPRHIAKYTAQHRALFPLSPILLLRQDGGDFTWRPEAWQMQAMTRAVEVISNLRARPSLSSTATTSSTLPPRVLMHVLSNGGAYTAYILEKSCNSYHHQQTESQSNSNSAPLLPINALILDSLPGRTTLPIAVTAFSQILPPTLAPPLRYLGISALYALIFTMRLPSYLPWPIYKPDQLALSRARLNARESAFMRESVAERAYIYSEEDKLIPWRDVETHAAEAEGGLRGGSSSSEEKGAGEQQERVKLEKFMGSGHVAHAMADAERYWRIVTGAWRAAVEKNEKRE